MTVAEMLARISSAELTEWMAYEQVSGPLGGERDDVLMAILAAVVANGNRGKGRKVKPKDLLPKWDQTKQAMGWQDMLAAVKTLNRSLGGADLTEEGMRHGDPGRAAGTARHRRGRADRRGVQSGR